MIVVDDDDDDDDAAEKYRLAGSILGDGSSCRLEMPGRGYMYQL